MNRLITTSVGGFPKVLDDLRWFLGQAIGNQGIYQALNNLLRLFGDNFIVQGATLPGDGTILEGWVMLDGELLKVDLHSPGADTFFTKVTTFDPAGDKKAQNGSDIQAYQINRAVVNAGSGNLPLAGVRFEDQIIPAIRDQTNSKATQIQNGLIEIATQAETLAGTDSTRALSPFSMNTRLPLVQKVLSIGNWDMNANGSPVNNPIIHGLSDFTKIRAVDALIFKDLNDDIIPLLSSDSSGVQEGRIIILPNAVNLIRRTGGSFQSSSYNEASFNRGFITIWHTL